MPEAPSTSPAEASAGGPPRNEAPKIVGTTGAGESRQQGSNVLGELQRMADASAHDTLRTLGTPNISRHEIQGNKKPVVPENNTGQAGEAGSTLPDPDQPQINPKTTIEQSLEDLANSPQTDASPDEEAAIARTKLILNQDTQTPTPAEVASNQTDIAQQNQKFIDSANFKEPTAEARAAGARVTKAPSPAPTDVSTESPAPTTPTEAITTNAATTGEATSASTPIETPAAEASADSAADTSKTPTDTTESPKDKKADAATESSEQPQSRAEQLASMAEIGAQLNELGIDLNGQQGRDLLALLGENPDRIIDFQESISRAQAIGKDLAEALSKHGINLSGEQATTAAVDILIQQLGGNIAGQTGDGEVDAVEDEGKKGNEVLMKILKALLLALAVVATAPITVPLLAGYGTGALTMSKK